MSHSIAGPSVEPGSLVDVLRYRAVHQADKRAYTFLLDGRTQAVSMAYADLDRRARSIGAWLQSQGAAGERVLLLYPPGLDYIAAFFGALYAGAVAVPAYPSRMNRKGDRPDAIIHDAQPAIALTTDQFLPRIESLQHQPSGAKGLLCQSSDGIDDELAGQWKDPKLEGDALAFLQYTSGSTSIPKGVMVTHGNLLSNEKLIERAFQQTSESVIVGWLPLFHDMGLIGNVLQTMYVGAQCILLSPVAFLQRPASWLEAISSYRGTTSGGPNFAYDLCVRKISPAEREGLDLSSWTVAFNGSEPIREDTLARFADAFAPCGFQPAAFYPCYGLAEATLFVSGGLKMGGTTVRTVLRTSLEQNRVVAALGENTETRKLVSCGRSWLNQQIVIVDPQSSVECPPGRVGEIWVRGPSIAEGYWRRPEESQRTFRAFLADTGDGPFLRTGDLGFVDDGELYVAGRLKDLIIIRGRNHYPQDIERSVEQSHPGLRPGGVAAFSVEIGGEERLVVVQEIDRQSLNRDLEEVAGAIRQAVAEEHEIQVYAVALVKPGSVPKTSSGKVQRRACRAAFLAGTLNPIETFIIPTAGPESGERQQDTVSREEVPALDSDQERQSRLERHIRNQVAQVMGIALSTIPLHQPLARLGLDSLKAIELQNRIETDFGVFLSMSSFLQAASISDVASQVAALLISSKSPTLSAGALARTQGPEPLSYGQHGLWFLEQLDPGNPAYNICTTFRLSGSLNLIALEQAVGEIISRHESLRTTFAAIKGQPIQVINPARPFSLPIIDLTTLAGDDPESVGFQVVAEEAQRAFRLNEGPLLRVTLLRAPAGGDLLILTMHHIISDGWSLGIFLREMADLYESFLGGRASALDELPIQYADFARWQREWVESEVLQNQSAYWKRVFAAQPARLRLPTKRRLGTEPSARAACHWFTISRECGDALKALACVESSTLFMTLLAALKALLHICTGQNDIVVGTPIAGRNRADLERLIGFFLNTLALRTDVSSSLTFRELLGRVRQVALQAFENQDLPFERVVSLAAAERDADRAPLYQVWFVLQMGPVPTLALPQLEMVPVETDLQTTKFDLALNLTETSAGIRGFFEYKTDLFEAATIARLARDYQLVLDQVRRQPDATIEVLEEAIFEKDGTRRLGPSEDFTDSLRGRLKLIKRQVLSTNRKTTV